MLRYQTADGKAFLYCAVLQLVRPMILLLNRAEGVLVLVKKVAVFVLVSSWWETGLFLLGKVTSLY